MPTRHHRTLPLALAIALLAGCDEGSPGGDHSAGAAAMPVAAPLPKVSTDADAPAAGAFVAIGGGATGRAAELAPAAPAAAAPPAASNQLPSAVAASPESPMLIRRGTASIQVDTLPKGIEGVRALAARVGALVANMSVDAGQRQFASATLELRVPAARFDELVNGLTPLGRVETIQVQVQDVGEEYTDVSARVANARRLEQRLVELLATRTGRLADVLSVERELARVREEIERYEGRLRYLRTNVAYSSLTVTVHEPLPVVAGPPGENPIARAFREAWRNFVQVIAVLIASMGLVVPIGALGVGAWVLVRRWRRRIDGLTV